jgi:hypothetical protein
MFNSFFIGLAIGLSGMFILLHAPAWFSVLQFLYSEKLRTLTVWASGILYRYHTDLVAMSVIKAQNATPAEILEVWKNAQIVRGRKPDVVFMDVFKTPIAGRSKSYEGIVNGLYIPSTPESDERYREHYCERVATSN